MPNCKYFEACNQQSVGNINGEEYCILHYPQRNKHQGNFQHALTIMLRQQRSNFRNVIFPAGAVFKASNQKFSELLNFKGATLESFIELEGATLSKGLSISVEKIQSINLARATIDGPVKIEIANELHEFNSEGARINSSFHLSAKTCPRLLFSETKFQERLSIFVESTIRDAYFHRAELRGGLEIQGTSVGTVNLNSTLVAGTSNLRFTAGAGSIVAPNCHLQADTVIETASIHQLNLRDAEIYDLRTSGARIEEVNFVGTKLNKKMTFHKCHFLKEMSFEVIEFKSPSSIVLSDSVFAENLSITGSLTTPESIDIDGCRVDKDVTIRAELGKPSIKVLAKNKRPDFRGDVVFENVSLVECRLLGNAFDRMHTRNVEWKKKNKRAVLCDEIVLPKTSGVTKAMKEAYQVLKEQYRSVGDHITSGDFHYGEMEMIRCELGYVRRHFGLTAWYRALNGYGTEPARALRMLAYVVVLITGLFALGVEGTLTEIALRSFELTLQAASFQPLTAAQVSDGGLSIYMRLIFSAARIVLPLQAGLLALAVRMRLKR